MARPAAPLRGEPASGTSGAALTYPSAPGPLLSSFLSAALWLMPPVMSSSAGCKGLLKLSCGQFDRPMWQCMPALHAGGTQKAGSGLTAL